MTTIAEVAIWNTRVGAVAWDDTLNLARFEYAPEFLKVGWELAPLTMPIATTDQRIFSFPTLNYETFKGLPGLLADSLPDRFGNQLIDVWLAQQGRTPAQMNPVERLCYIGKRGMGALEFEPAVYAGLGTAGRLDVQELVELARQVLGERGQLTVNLHDSTQKGLQEILRVGTSAGGARSKAIIAYHPKTGEVRSGQIDQQPGFEYWLIKFDGVTNQQLGDPLEYGRIEYAYYLMANAAGIGMAESRLLTENGRAHFMTKRFDRDGTKKLHMQSLCALAHYDYNQPGAYAYEQVFQLMRQLKLPYADKEQLFRRLVLNVVAKNQDDHTKNIAFLMDQSGQWRLSPAYDVTYAFNPESRWTSSHQLSVQGKRSGITRNDLLKLAAKENIKKANAIIEEVKEVVGNWTTFAVEAGIAKAQRKQIGHTFFK